MNELARFSVTSDGTTGKDWIKRLEDKGFRVGSYAKQALSSPDFKPTNNITTETVIFSGSMERMPLVDEALFSKVNAELACLIREKLTDEELKEMGLVWVIAMHEPIDNPDGESYLLAVSRCEEGLLLGAQLMTSNPYFLPMDPGGFAFAVSPSA